MVSIFQDRQDIEGSYLQSWRTDNLCLGHCNLAGDLLVKHGWPETLALESTQHENQARLVLGLNPASLSQKSLPFYHHHHHHHHQHHPRVICWWFTSTSTWGKLCLSSRRLLLFRQSHAGYHSHWGRSQGTQTVYRILVVTNKNFIEVLFDLENMKKGHIDLGKGETNVWKER